MIQTYFSLCLGAFLTAMTFDRIRVEHYMTKFSFLTVFFLCVWVPPKRLLAPRGALFNRFCAVLC